METLDLQLIHKECGNWRVRLYIGKCLMKDCDFKRNEQRARSFYRLVSDIIHYIEDGN